MDDNFATSQKKKVKHGLENAFIYQHSTILERDFVNIIIYLRIRTWIFWCSKRGFRYGNVLRHLLEKQLYLDPPILSLTISGN